MREVIKGIIWICISGFLFILSILTEVYINAKLSLFLIIGWSWLLYRYAIREIRNIIRSVNNEKSF